MNHIPEKASQPNPYTAAGWGTEGLVRYYLFSSTLVVEVCVSFYVFWDADNPILGLFWAILTIFRLRCRLRKILISLVCEI